MNFRYLRLFLALTLGLSLSAVSSAVMAQDALTQAITHPGDTLAQVKLELWTQGINAEAAPEVADQAVKIPEELTLGLEKWQSSL